MTAEAMGRCKARAGAYNYRLVVITREESFSMSRLAGPQFSVNHPQMNRSVGSVNFSVEPSFGPSVGPSVGGEDVS